MDRIDGNPSFSFQICPNEEGGKLFITAWFEASVSAILGGLFIEGGDAWRD